MRFQAANAGVPLPNGSMKFLGYPVEGKHEIFGQFMFVRLREGLMP
jgi:hypothetical protein